MDEILAIITEIVIEGAIDASGSENNTIKKLALTLFTIGTIFLFALAFMVKSEPELFWAMIVLGSMGLMIIVPSFIKSLQNKKDR